MCFLQTKPPPLPTCPVSHNHQSVCLPAFPPSSTPSSHLIFSLFTSFLLSRSITSPLPFPPLPPLPSFPPTLKSSESGPFSCRSLVARVRVRDHSDPVWSEWPNHGLRFPPGRWLLCEDIQTDRPACTSPRRVCGDSLNVCVLVKYTRMQISSSTIFNYTGLRLHQKLPVYERGLSVFCACYHCIYSHVFSLKHCCFFGFVFFFLVKC